MRLAPLILLLSALPLAAAVTLSQDAQEKNVYRFDSPTATIEVDTAAGARIRSWRLKPSGRDLIALWAGPQEVGGALDDRLTFTAVAYDASLAQPGPELAVLRTESRNAAGFELIKHLQLDGDGRRLKVVYQFRNGTQAPQRLMIRNFLLPGPKPVGEDHLYWVNTGEGTPLLAGWPTANGYYPAGDPAFAALWERTSGDGILVFGKGIDRFYFWRGSREFPTFEWLYPDLPAGQASTVELVLEPVIGATTAPDWYAAVAALQPALAAPRTAGLEGWQDLAARFGVTEAEREQGFWLTSGEGDGLQRLTTPLALDLPRGESRAVNLGIRPLRDQTVTLGARVPAGVTVTRDTPGDQRRELLPLPTTPLTLSNGGLETLWLDVRGDQRGTTTVPLELTVGATTVTVPLAITVWDHPALDAQPFHVRGYSGGWTVWSGNDASETNLARLDAILAAYAGIGGDVIDFNTAWHRLLPNVKLAETGMSLAEVKDAAPEKLALDNLPALDFSAFDPWFELARRHGVRRVETYLESPASSRWQWVFLDPVFGPGKVVYDTPEAERVLVWWYTELRRYFETQGLTGFFCKISDEIPPEEIPQYLRTAKLVERTGWRPFTTITGMIARSAALLEQMDPYCDQWQLAFGLKDDFLHLRDSRFRLETQTIPLPDEWGRYTNGGATETYAQRVFGEGGTAGFGADQVESFELLEDGRPLPAEGGSPWGNQNRGVVITSGSLKTHLYLSPSSGEPSDHRYELQVQRRLEAADGQPLIELDPDDEIWCYGGGSSPFRAPYHSGYQYPLMTFHHGFEGYGQWAFYHWNPTEKIVWLSDDNQLTISPVYLGYRDGWRDAVLLAAVRKAGGAAALEPLLGPSPAAAVRVGPRAAEVYRFTTLLNGDDPTARNELRRRALAALQR